MSHQLWIINYDSFEGTHILPLSSNEPSSLTWSDEPFPILSDWFGSVKTSSSSFEWRPECKLCPVSGVTSVRGLGGLRSQEHRLICSNSSNLDVIEHRRDSCEYSDKQLSSFPRVFTERELFKTFDVGFKEFERFDFSVLIEHWLDRIDLISVKLAQEVITSGIAKLQRPSEYKPWIYFIYSVNKFKSLTSVGHLRSNSFAYDMQHIISSKWNYLPNEFSMTPDVASELKPFFIEWWKLRLQNRAEKSIKIIWRITYRSGHMHTWWRSEYHYIIDVSVYQDTRFLTGCS